MALPHEFSPDQAIEFLDRSGGVIRGLSMALTAVTTERSALRAERDRLLVENATSHVVRAKVEAELRDVRKSNTELRVSLVDAEARVAELLKAPAKAPAVPFRTTILIPSSKAGAMPYEVTMHGDAPVSCECKGFEWRGYCRHIIEARNRNR